MIGLVLAAAAVGAVAGQLEVNPSVTAESRAGEAPVVYGGAPEGSLVEVLTPGAELAYVGRRLELRASYELRLFWRSTSQIPHPSPLFLNTVNLGMTAHATPRLTLKLSGSSFEGEADYTYLPSIYGQNQATLLVVPKIFAANVAGSAELHLTRLVTAGLALQASHSQPIGDSRTTAAVPSGPTAVYTLPHVTGPTPVYTLPHFTSLAATPGAAVHVSRTDDVNPALAFEYQQISSLTAPAKTSGAAQPESSISAFIVMPTIGVRRLLSLHSEFSLKAGLSVTHLAGVPNDPNSVGPIGGADLDVRLLNLRQAVLHSKASVSLEYYLDPVLGTPATHVFATGSFYLGLPQNWTIGLQGSFVSSLKDHPLGSAPPFTYPDEIAAAAELPVRHLLSRDLLLEFGGKWADRSPFFTAPNYGFHQRQLWVYVMLTGATRPTWLPPRGVAPPP
jgi:hypothetical protein